MSLQEKLEQAKTQMKREYAKQQTLYDKNAPDTLELQAKRKKMGVIVFGTGIVLSACIFIIYLLTETILLALTAAALVLVIGGLYQLITGNTVKK